MGEVGCMLGGRACGCRSWGEGNGRRGENEWASWISNYMYVRMCLQVQLKRTKQVELTA